MFWLRKKALVITSNDKKWKKAKDRRSKLLFEVNSVQRLLLFNVFLAKQWKSNLK